MEQHLTVYQVLKDVLLLLFAGLGSITAFYGLRVWRKQLKGKTEYELARRMLLSVYKIRDAIKVVRNPFIPVGEIYEAKKEYQKEDIGGTIANRENDNYAVYKSRWKSILEAFSSLDLDLLEAEVIFDDKLGEEYKKLKRLVLKLSMAIQECLRYQSKSSLNKNDIKRNEQYEILMYDHSSEDEEDSYSQEINEVVIKFEQKLRKYLK